MRALLFSTLVLLVVGCGGESRTDTPSGSGEGEVKDKQRVDQPTNQVGPYAQRPSQDLEAFLNRCCGDRRGASSLVVVRLMGNSEGKLEQMNVGEQTADIRKFRSILEYFAESNDSKTAGKSWLLIGADARLQFEHTMAILAIGVPPEGRPLIGEFAFEPSELPRSGDARALRASSMPDGSTDDIEALRDAWRYRSEPPRAFRLLWKIAGSKPPAKTLLVEAQVGQDGELVSVTVDGGARLDAEGKALREKVLAFATKKESPLCVALRLPPNLRHEHAVMLCKVLTRDRVIRGRVVQLIDQFEISLTSADAPTQRVTPVYNPYLLANEEVEMMLAPDDVLAPTEITTEPTELQTEP